MAAAVADKRAGGEHTAVVACEDKAVGGNISSFESDFDYQMAMSSPAGLGAANVRIRLR